MQKYFIEYHKYQLAALFPCQFSAISMGALGYPSVLMALKWNDGIRV